MKIASIIKQSSSWILIKEGMEVLFIKGNPPISLLQICMPSLKEFVIKPIMGG
jgi:hypothetical protein